MKNYLCINGVKIELTDEQVVCFKSENKPIVNISEDGEIATVGKYDFIILKRTEDEVHLLLKESLGDQQFGDTNDFRTSAVKTRLEEFANEIASIVGEDNLLSHSVDLTSDDGLKDYGSTEAKMSPLTTDRYREFVYTIDKYRLDKSWWLATPFSTPTHNDVDWVKCVAPSGVISNGRYYGYVGVRPFCILKSDIFVS